MHPIKKRPASDRVVLLIRLITFSPFSAIVVMSHGQKRVRHSGRLLGRPNAIKCSRRPRQLKDARSGHYYFISEATNFKVSYY